MKEVTAMTVDETQENMEGDQKSDKDDILDTDAIQIDMNTFYRPAELKKIFGIRFVNHLTTSGLRSLGGWYSGKRILEAYEQAAQNKSSQRVPARMEVINEPEHARKKVRVEKIARNNKVQLISRGPKKDSLRSQLEETRAARRTSTLRSKAV